MATEGGAGTRLDGTIVLGLAANCGQVRQVVHVVAIDVTLPTTWRGPVDRLPMMWVECAVWSSWAGHWYSVMARYSLHLIGNFDFS